MKKYSIRGKIFSIAIVCVTMVYSAMCWAKLFRLLPAYSVPEASIVSVDGYIEQLKSLWEDSIVKQKEVAKIDAKYTYYTTGEIASIQVLKGEEPWLFYKGTLDGDPIADYEGTNMHTEDELVQMQNAVLKTKEKLLERGIQLAVMIAPNKSSVYYNYMPDSYHRADVSRSDVIVDRLSQSNINITTPKTELCKYSETYPLYYYYDTHWNQLGGYVGVKEILRTWGIELPELNELEINASPLKEQYHYCAKDDLAGMVGLLSVFDDDVEYKIVDDQLKAIEVDWTVFENEQESGTVSHFVNEDAEINQKVFLVGDSFRTAMVPTLSAVFRDVYVIQWGNYMPVLLDEIQPDFVIAEYVERFSKNIANIEQLIEE